MEVSVSALCVVHVRAGKQMCVCVCVAASLFMCACAPNTYSQYDDPLLILAMLLCVSSWNEWLRLPLKYPDLPQSAQVALTIWDVYGPGRATPVGGTTVTLFGKHGSV